MSNEVMEIDPANNAPASSQKWPPRFSDRAAPDLKKSACHSDYVDIARGRQIYPTPTPPGLLSRSNQPNIASIPRFASSFAASTMNDLEQYQWLNHETALMGHECTAQLCTIACAVVTSCAWET